MSSPLQSWEEVRCSGRVLVYPSLAASVRLREQGGLRAHGGCEEPT
jgi:hypothetical protein